MNERRVLAENSAPTNRAMTQPLCALLMAGGSGLRLWPLSRPQRTKPFLKRIGGDRSLLADTAARLPFVPPSQLFVNVTRGLEGLVRTELPDIPEDHVVVAPEDRDTLPTLLFATSHIASKVPDATLLLLASDNTIGDEAMFRATIDRAVAAARSGPYLVSLGIKPTEASSRFGYMALGEEFPGLEETWFGTGYLEKPKQHVADELFAGGRHDWNSGMFVWTVSTFRRALEAYAKPEAEVFAQLCATRSDSERAELFRKLSPVAVDHGLLEHVPASGGSVRHVFVRGRFPWDDLGTFDSMTKHLPIDSEGNTVTPLVTVKDCKGSMLVSEGPRALEVENLVDTCVIVSDEGDTLVVPKAHLGDIRSMLLERIVLPTVVVGGSVHVSESALVRARDSSENRVVANEAKVVGLIQVRNTEVVVEDTRVRVRGGVRAEPRPAMLATPRIVVATDEMELARVGAELVVEALEAALDGTDREVLITMSAGETPVGIYRALVQHHKSALPWRRVRLVQMDEWIGIGPDDPRSFAYYLRTKLAEPLGLASTLMDGRAGAASTIAIENEVLSKGGFDFALHGIGTNGHLGFNEPPDDGTSRARQTRLAESTRRAAETVFAGDVPTEGLTLGLQSLGKAKKTLVAARGAKKAAAIRAMLAEPSPECPASVVPRTRALDVLLDRDSLSGLLGVRRAT